MLFKCVCFCSIEKFPSCEMFPACLAGEAQIPSMPEAGGSIRTCFWAMWFATKWDFLNGKNQLVQFTLLIYHKHQPTCRYCLTPLCVLGFAMWDQPCLTGGCPISAGCARCRGAARNVWRRCGERSPHPGCLGYWMVYYPVMWGLFQKLS